MNAFLALEQLDEQAGVAQVLAKRVVDQVAMVAQQADGVGAYALDIRMLGEQHEGFQDGERRALEDRRVADFQIAVAYLEAAVERNDRA